jgi:hypothetical protein
LQPPTFGKEVAGQGWCTGAVVAHDDVAALKEYLTRPGARPTEVNPEDWLVVVSQTCDIVAAKLESEPFVEVLHCRPIKKLRGEFKGLRSTRTLDFKPDRDTHKNLSLSAHAVADRYNIPREFFRDRKPDGARKLSAASTKRVLDWYALRPARPAWPNSFARRFRDTTDALIEALEPLKDDVAEVRVAVVEVDEELEENLPYHIAVFFVVDQLDWDADAQARQATYESFNKFVAALRACKGIEVNEEISRVAPGEQFTWQETRYSDLWNFANLSNLDD